MEGVDLFLSSGALSVCVTFVTEFMKFFPYFQKTKFRKQMLCLGVSVVTSTIYCLMNPGITALGGLSLFVMVMSLSFGLYKSLIEVVEDNVIKPEETKTN